MKAEIKQNGKGKELIVTLALDEKGYLTDSEKTFVHATSHGNVECGCVVNGKALYVGVTAYTRNPDFKRPPKS